MNLGHQLFQAEFCRQVHDFIDHKGAQPPALELLGDYHPDVSQVALPAHLAHVQGGVPHNLAVRLGDERKDPMIIDVIHPIVDGGRVPHVVAQKHQIPFIDPAEEVQELVPVFLYHGTQDHPGAVLQNPFFLVLRHFSPLSNALGQPLRQEFGEPGLEDAVLRRSHVVWD